MKCPPVERYWIVLSLLIFFVGCEAGPVTIDSNDMRELCFKAEEGATITYRFEASAALDFNVHYHIGNDIFFPVPEHTTAAEKGHYVVPMTQTYCLKWSNDSDAAVVLDAVVEGGQQIRLH